MFTSRIIEIWLGRLLLESRKLVVIFAEFPRDKQIHSRQNAAPGFVSCLLGILFRHARYTISVFSSLRRLRRSTSDSAARGRVCEVKVFRVLNHRRKFREAASSAASSPPSGFRLYLFIYLSLVRSRRISQLWLRNSRVICKLIDLNFSDR